MTVRSLLRHFKGGLKAVSVQDWCLFGYDEGAITIVREDAGLVFPVLEMEVDEWSTDGSAIEIRVK